MIHLVFAIFIMVSIDLFSKHWITQVLSIHLNYTQRNSYLSNDTEHYLITPREQLSILGDGGKYMRFKLYFNDKFALGRGFPLYKGGLLIAFFSTLVIFFAFIYLEKLRILFFNAIAWILILSGAIANLIDRMTVVSMQTRAWQVSLRPIPDHISGVVDFIDIAWLNWKIFYNVPLLEFLSYKRLPVFNLADLYLFCGFCLLIYIYSKDLWLHKLRIYKQKIMNKISQASIKKREKE